jgi:penicillin-binding protein 2
MSGDDGRHRLGLIAVTALSLFGALFARLWFLQVVEGNSLEAAASRNATRTVVIPAPRGRILDRNGVVLVDDRESITVSIDSQTFEQLEAGRQGRVLKRLATELSYGQPAGKQVTAKFLRTRLNDTRFSHFRPVPVAADIGQDLEIALREQSGEFPGVQVDRQTVRTYPYGSLAAHLLGYVGALSDTQWNNLKDHNDAKKPYIQNDEIGKGGVEQSYEQYLRGTPGKRVYEVDRRNRVVGELLSARVEPKRGDDLYLSVDARIQAEAEHALRSEINALRHTRKHLGYVPAEGAATAIVDPTNGQVMAMASFPTYNPSDLVGGISCPEWRSLQGLDPAGSCKNVQKEIDAMPSDSRPISKLSNRAIAGLYPPGSTFKLATALVGLKLGLITPDTPYYDPGFYEIPNCSGEHCRPRGPDEGPGGPMDLSRAITKSSDPYFYKLGNDSWAAYKQQHRVSDSAFQHIAATLGFGSRTGIDVAGEAAGRLPDPKWLKTFDEALNGHATDAGNWTAGTSVNMSIGQGYVLVTPLQLANAYAAFANGGTLFQPTVVDRITAYRHPEKVLFKPAQKVLQKIDWGATNHDAMLTGFEGATQTGTAAGAFEGFPAGWVTAGKTGTAQTGTPTHPKVDHSWFVGFGPNPAARYSAAMIMEHAGFGADAAAPAIRQILEAIATNSLDQIDLASLSDPSKEGVLKTGAVDPTTSTSTTTPGTGGTTTTTPGNDTIAPVPGTGKND